MYVRIVRTVQHLLRNAFFFSTQVFSPEIPHTLDPSLLSFLVVPLVRELRSTRSCDFLNRGGGFIKGILRGVRMQLLSGAELFGNIIVPYSELTSEYHIGA